MLLYSKNLNESQCSIKNCKICDIASRCKECFEGFTLLPDSTVCSNFSCNIVNEFISE